MSDTINIAISEQSISATFTAAAVSPAPTAENNFLVGSSSLNWVRKTLTQVKTILGLGSAAYTDSTDYATAGHTHAAPAYEFQTTTVSGNTELTLSGIVAGNAGMLVVNIDSGGPYNITLSNVFNHKLNDETVDNTANGVTYISWICTVVSLGVPKVAYTILKPV